MTRVLVIDHEDSFAQNLVQELARQGAKVSCLRSTRPWAEAEAADPEAIVLSPGPGQPSDRRRTRLSRAILRRWGRSRPILGVCLGHQLIADYCGGHIVRAPEPVHGDTDRIVHAGDPLFRGVPSPFRAARYHSLLVDARRLPAALEPIAWGTGGVLMGLRHTRWPVCGVQFHPESYLTPEGPTILANFLAEVRR
jgi:anthranilate synthase/aminodeoxychorismate synthase-like glutamine amidotransferase